MTSTPTPSTSPTNTRTPSSTISNSPSPSNSPPPILPGDKWTKRGDSTARLWTSIAGSSDGTKQIASSYTDKLYISNDTGLTWSAIHKTDTWKTICANSDFSRIIAATQTTFIISLSTDSGITFNDTTINSNQAWLKCAMSANGQVTVMGPQQFNALISTDGFSTYNNMNSGIGDHRGISISNDGTRIAVAHMYAGVYSIRYSVDTGSTFTTVSLNKQWKGLAGSSNGTHLVAITNNDFLYISRDGGQSWNATLTDTGRAWVSVCCSKDFMVIAAVVYGGNIWLSRDGGNTFTAKDSTRFWFAIYCNDDGTKFTAGVYNGFLYTSP